MRAVLTLIADQTTVQLPDKQVCTNILHNVTYNYNASFTRLLAGNTLSARKLTNDNTIVTLQVQLPHPFGHFFTAVSKIHTLAIYNLFVGCTVASKHICGVSARTCKLMLTTENKDARTSLCHRQRWTACEAFL